MEDTKIEEGFKRCSRCGDVKPISDFNKCKRKSDGLQCLCKQCNKEYQAEWRNLNKEKIAEYYQANKDTIHKKDAEYRANNKEAIAQKKAEYYQANKDTIHKKQAEYRDPIINPLGWAREIVGNYRDMDRERGFDTSKTVTAEWFVQNIMYKPCAHCGLLQAGAIGANRLNNNIGHEASNLEPCCRNCNSRLGAIDQIARGLHVSCKHKKQSFKDFVEEHKAKDKNSQ